MLRREHKVLGGRQILLLLLIWSGQVVGQCCRFEVLPNTIDLEILDSVLEESKTDCTDLSFCRLANLARAFSNANFDSIYYQFRLAAVEIDRQQNITPEHLKLVLKYSYVLKSMGESDKASFYYQYVNSHPNASSVEKLWSLIGIEGRSSLFENSQGLGHNLMNEISGFKPEDQAISVIMALDYFELTEKGAFLRNYIDLGKSIHYSVEGIILLDYILAYCFESESSEEKKLRLKLKEFEAKEGLYYTPSSSFIREARLEKWNRDYINYLELTRKAVVEDIGEFKRVGDLIQIYKNQPFYNEVTLETYATANLYQTRVKEGLEPVYDAFAMYEAVYEKSLTKKYESMSSLTGERPSILRPEYENLIIVGNYLHQKTGKIEYLNRAVRILDGYAGAGALFWAKTRQQMRTDDTFRTGYEALRQTDSELRANTSTLSLTELHDRVQDLRNQENAFKEKYPNVFGGNYPEADTDLDEIAARMATDSAATVSFYTNGKMLYRLYVSGDSLEVKILNQHLREVEALSASLPRLLANPRAPAAADTQSYRLYEMLFGDLGPVLPERLHIIPGGILVDIPFAGLRTTPPGETADYFGTRYALSQQFSIGSMLALRDMDLNPRYARPLALAPSFGNDFVAASELRQAGFALPPLLYSREEVENLESRSAGRYLYDERASIGNYRENASDHGIIHLATHAISSQLDGVKSRVFLLDEAGDPVPLYASEIGDQTLNADLVVLSACETGGGGRHEVEGRVGLTKAYLAAGARSVVSSSWSVDDHATAELMETFYTAIADGQPPHEALRTARRAYREARPDAPVSDWAAFEAYGGMKPIRWSPEEERLPWGWLGAGAALLGMAGVAWQRRTAA